MNPTATLRPPNATTIGRTNQSSYLVVPAGQQSTLRLTPTGQTTTVRNITAAGLTSGTVTTIVVTDAATGSTSLRTFTFPECT